MTGQPHLVKVVTWQRMRRARGCTPKRKQEAPGSCVTACAQQCPPRLPERHPSLGMSLSPLQGSTTSLHCHTGNQGSTCEPWGTQSSHRVCLSCFMVRDLYEPKLAALWQISLSFFSAYLLLVFFMVFLELSVKTTKQPSDSAKNNFRL